MFTDNPADYFDGQKPDPNKQTQSELDDIDLGGLHWTGDEALNWASFYTHVLDVKRPDLAYSKFSGGMYPKTTHLVVVDAELTIEHIFAGVANLKEKCFDLWGDNAKTLHEHIKYDKRYGVGTYAVRIPTPESVRKLERSEIDMLLKKFPHRVGWMTLLERVLLEVWWRVRYNMPFAPNVRSICIVPALNAKGFVKMEAFTEGMTGAFVVQSLPKEVFDRNKLSGAIIYKALPVIF